MNPEPKSTHWYQFSLRSAIVATAFVATVFTVFLRERSFRELTENRRMYDRLDQATQLFNVQLAMAEDRLASMKEPCQLNNCVRRDRKIDGYQGLEILESWDFDWRGEPNRNELRRKIRECIGPIMWLDGDGPRSAWHVKQEVNFSDERHQGEIIVTATYEPYPGG